MCVLFFNYTWKSENKRSFYFQLQKGQETGQVQGKNFLVTAPSYVDKEKLVVRPSKFQTKEKKSHLLAKCLIRGTVAMLLEFVLHGTITFALYILEYMFMNIVEIHSIRLNLVLQGYPQSFSCVFPLGYVWIKDLVREKEIEMEKVDDPMVPEWLNHLTFSFSFLFSSPNLGSEHSLTIFLKRNDYI